MEQKKFALIILLFLSSCARLLKNKDQEVVIFPPPPRGEIKVTIKDRQYILKDLPAKIYLKRQTKALPLLLECPDKNPMEVKLKPTYDILVSGLGNIFNLGLGWLVDYNHPKSYDFPNLNVGPLCGHGSEGASLYPKKKRVLIK